MSLNEEQILENCKSWLELNSLNWHEYSRTSKAIHNPYWLLLIENSVHDVLFCILLICKEWIHKASIVGNQLTFFSFTEWQSINSKRVHLNPSTIFQPFQNFWMVKLNSFDVKPTHTSTLTGNLFTGNLTKHFLLKRHLNIYHKHFFA